MKKRILPRGVTEKEFEKWEYEMRRYIGTLPCSDVTRIGHFLNTYTWLDELPGKPEGWDDMDNFERHLWIRDIYKSIRIYVGDKAILRYFHTTELGKTDREFEDWWVSYHVSNVEHVPDHTPISLIVFSGIALGVAIATLLFKILN